MIFQPIFIFKALLAIITFENLGKVGDIYTLSETDPVRAQEQNKTGIFSI